MSIMRNLVTRLLFVVCISGLLAACQEVEFAHWTGGGTKGDEIAASAEMDEAFLRAYARRMFAAKEHAGRVTPEYVLEHVQNMEALIAEGRARNLDRLPEFRQAVHQFQAELLLRTMQPDLVPEIPRDSVTNEDARVFFQENIRLYALPDLYLATMFHTREKGEAVVLGGAGSCGPVMMREDSFVVLCLDGVQRDRTQDFETRKEFIRNDVLYSRYREAWREVYAGLRERHGVSVDPGVAERFTVEGLREDGAPTLKP